jgi:hypothetical protein
VLLFHQYLGILMSFLVHMDKTSLQPYLNHESLFSPASHCPVTGGPGDEVV